MKDLWSCHPVGSAILFPEKRPKYLALIMIQTENRFKLISITRFKFFIVPMTNYGHDLILGFATSVARCF